MACDMNELVIKYINGEDLGNNSLEKLENNKRFMEKVLDLSGDIKMYHYCSERVKTDSGFIRFLIKGFRDNLDFLCEVSDYYFSNTNDSDYVIEIAIIMRNVLKGNNDERYTNYELMCDVMYTALRLQVEHAKLFEKDDYQFQSDTGLGFYYVFDLYKNNEIVTNFYAKKMINEIFINDYYALDRILHKQFSSIEKIEKKGIFNSLIDAIRVYDDMLADYVCIHKSLLKKVIKKYQSVEKRWDSFIDVDESNRFDRLDDEVYKYAETIENQSVLSVREIITIIGIQLGIEEKLIQYQIIDSIDVDMIREDGKKYADIIKQSFVDKLMYTNIRDIIKRVLFDNKKEEEKEESETETKEEYGKVLDFEDYLNAKRTRKTRQK